MERQVRDHLELLDGLVLCIHVDVEGEVAVDRAAQLIRDRVDDVAQVGFPVGLGRFDLSLPCAFHLSRDIGSRVRRLEPVGRDPEWLECCGRERR